MSEPDEDKSFKQIFLSKWMPAVIAAAIAGPLVAIFAPWLQSRYLEETTLANRKVELWESIGETFTHYINYRSRLNEAARWQKEQIESGEGVPDEFLARKETYRQNRDDYGDALRRDFLLAEFYYSSEVVALIDEFLDWHSQYRIATVDELPPDEAYQDWRSRIMIAMRDDLH